MEVSKRYAQRGVSAAKDEVHKAIKNIDKAKSKGLIHKNKAARQKQKLQLKLNKLGK